MNIYFTSEVIREVKLKYMDHYLNQILAYIAEEMKDTFVMLKTIKNFLKD